MLRSMLVTVLAGLLCAPAWGADSAAAKDEQALRQAVDGYVAAFNRGDAKEVAAWFTDDAEHVNEEGQAFHGKPAIEREIRTFLTDHPAVKLSVRIESVQFLKPDVALERGVATLTDAAGVASPSPYLAINVQQGGQWRIQSLQDLMPTPEPTRDDKLAALGWLVGKWVDQDDHTTAHSSYAWSANKSFIVGSFSLVIGDRVNLAGTQVIGWDPIAKQVHCWIFDSEGGFGEGLWTQDGDRWTVKCKGVTGDGKKCSATRIYTHVDDNTYTWRAIDREADGAMLPDFDEIKVMRVPEEQAKPAKE